MDYPPQWEADVVLADGGTMHVRPVRPEDTSLIETFHARQSAESIYYRYFSPRPTLSGKDLDHLTQVDYVDRMAFVGLLGDELVGIARYDRYPTTGKAEVAFFTDDAHQGRGMATVLLEYLAAVAREAGLEGFVAQVLPQNRKMLSVFKQAGFEVQSRFEDGVIEVELGIESTPEARALMEERARHAFARSVQRLLAPTSIAVIGASRRPGSIGHDMVRRLIEGGFQGPVYPVNPTARSVASVRAYPNVRDVPDDVDLAVICVPAAEVRSVVEDCARKHVRGLVVVSAGFSESGEMGAQAERDVVELAHRHGMRLVGPNSMGVINTDVEVSMQATFVGIEPLRGTIGVSSQSGTLGAAIIGHARRLGLGISTFVSLGNKADVSSNDLLQFWEDDEATDLVLLHLESFGNPSNFARLTRRLTRHKPVVAVKSGRSVRLSDASDELPLEASMDALLSETGIIRVDTLEQLFDVALVVSRQPIPKGRRLAVVSNSWGPAMLAADAAVGAGLELADVAIEGRGANPIDLGYAAGATEFRSAVAQVLQSGAADAVLVMCTPPSQEDLHDISAAIAEVAEESDVPIVATYLGMDVEDGDQARDVPVFEFPEAAVHALGRVARYGEWLARDPGIMPDASMMDVDAVVVAMGAWDQGAKAAEWLDPTRRAAVVAAAGFDVVQRRLVVDGDEAVAAATALQWPVALKATGLARPAKTEAGGVAVDLHDEASLRQAFGRMQDLLGDAMHPAMVQQMAPPGVDVRVSLHRHPEVGSVVTLDVDRTYGPVTEGNVLQVVPFSDTDAMRMVEQSGLADVLRAACASGAIDESDAARRAIDAAAALLVRLSILGDTVPEVASVILDPVLVSERGAWVTDVRVQLRAVDRTPAPAVRRIDSGADS